MTFHLPYVYSMLGNYAFLSANQAWQSIKWGTVERAVKSLQNRIVKAVDSKQAIAALTLSV